MNTSNPYSRGSEGRLDKTNKWEVNGFGIEQKLQIPYTANKC